MVRIEGAKDVINGMKENTAGDTTTTGIALNEVTKIVNVHVRITEWKRKGLRTRDTKDGKRRGHAHSSGRREGRPHIGWGRGKGVGRGLRIGRRQLQGGWIHIGRRHPGIKGFQSGWRGL
jgi:hypothetical protein